MISSGACCIIGGRIDSAEPTRGAATNKHTLTLLDGHSQEVRIPAETLAALLDALLDGARHATRFAVEGRSTRSGPRPSWLDAACRLEITGLEAGSTVLKLEAPILQEIAPERFPSGFGVEASPIREGTSVDLFAQVLDSALSGPVGLVAADRPLIESCVRFGHVAQEAGGDLRLEGLTLPQKEKLLLKRQDVPRLELLRDQTPLPQAVRLSAQLDTISVNRAEVILIVEGHKVPVHLEDHRPDQLQNLFGKQVVVNGMGRFSPAGRLLLIEAGFLGEARPTDAIFSKIPEGRTAWRQSLLEAQSPDSGVASFFGKWPGEESDTELMAALEAIG